MTYTEYLITYDVWFYLVLAGICLHLGSKLVELLMRGVGITLVVVGVILGVITVLLPSGEYEVRIADEIGLEQPQNQQTKPIAQPTLDEGKPSPWRL